MTKSTRRTFLLPAYALLLLAICALVWWFLGAPGTSPAIGSNPCRVDDDHYDVNVLIKFGGEVEIRQFIEVNPTASKTTFSGDTGGPVAERIWMGDQFPATRSDARRPPTVLNNVGTQYDRHKEDGTWTDWESQRKNGRSPNPNVTSLCGYDLSGFNDLLRDGRERIYGTNTT